MAFLDEFQHLRIQLDEIKLATDNFDDNNFIGEGGFGKVYKGEISHFKGRSMVAFKRLDSRYGQGNSEFWKEIMMLSRYTNENLISLLGYCDEDGEKILVYEHASRGSLDRHLNDTTLTWTRRLKICLGVARGLHYLHDPMETKQRVLHRDIKSSNILLDENWNAKLSDLGLSKIGPANQQHTVLISNVVGTLGYLDPLYLEMGVLTKESDVYAFGVVLFEALCGRLCFEYSNGRFQSLVRMWKQSYKQKKIDEIIFQDLLQQMEPSSLEIFSDIAYQCLQEAREERPTMAYVAKELEIALEFQEVSDGVQQPEEYEEIIKTELPTLIYRSKVELKMLLSKGILVNGGKTWFSLNKKGEHIEMISAEECMFPIPKGPNGIGGWSKYLSRFAGVDCIGLTEKAKTHVKTQFLSPHITYTVNLVFKFVERDNTLRGPVYLHIRHKLEGEKEISNSYLAYRREDGWWMAELYQFTSDSRKFDLKIWFKGMYMHDNQMVEGIEFLPIQKVEHDALEDQKEDMQPKSDLDIDWGKKLPDDYEEIIKWSKDSKDGKKSHMLAARAAFIEHEWKWQSVPESRFEEVAVFCNGRWNIYCKIKPQLLSPQTTYACYFVYKVTKNHSDFEPPVQVSGDEGEPFIYLISPQTPVIRPKVNENTHNPQDIAKIKALPQLRNDGWMEVQVMEFRTDTTTEKNKVSVSLNSMTRVLLHGAIVQGIEFKPV